MDDGGGSSRPAIDLSGPCRNLHDVIDRCRDPRTTWGWDQAVHVIRTQPKLACEADGGGLPLHVACRGGKQGGGEEIGGVPIPVMRELIAVHPEALRILDTDGRLPLHLAAANLTSSGRSLPPSDVSIVGLLVQCFPESAEVGTKGDDGGGGLLPLHLAAANARGSGAAEVLQALLRAYPQAARTAATTEEGGDTLGGNYQTGWIPLHFAAANGAHPNAMAALVRAYPEGLFARDCRGDTPRAVAPSEALRGWIEGAERDLFGMRHSEDGSPKRSSSGGLKDDEEEERALGKDGISREQQGLSEAAEEESRCKNNNKMTSPDRGSKYCSLRAEEDANKEESGSGVDSKDEQQKEEGRSQQNIHQEKDNGRENGFHDENGAGIDDGSSSGSTVNQLSNGNAVDAVLHAGERGFSSGGRDNNEGADGASAASNCKSSAAKDGGDSEQPRSNSASCQGHQPSLPLKLGGECRNARDAELAGSGGRKRPRPCSRGRCPGGGGFTALPSVTSYNDRISQAEALWGMPPPMPGAPAPRSYVNRLRDLEARVFGDSAEEGSIPERLAAIVGEGPGSVRAAIGRAEELWEVAGASPSSSPRQQQPPAIPRGGVFESCVRRIESLEQTVFGSERAAEGRSYAERVQALF